MVRSHSTCTMSKQDTQNTDSADRDKWIGCEGLRAKRFLGSFSNVFKRRMKSGRSLGW